MVKVSTAASEEGWFVKFANQEIATSESAVL